MGWLKEGQKLSSSEGIVMSVSEHPDPAEQSSVVMLQIVRSQMTDAGKYSLLAENKNGSDRVDLDLIVIDEVPSATVTCSSTATWSVAVTSGSGRRQLTRRWHGWLPAW